MRQHGYWYWYWYWLELTTLEGEWGQRGQGEGRRERRGGHEAYFISSCIMSSCHITSHRISHHYRHHRISSLVLIFLLLFYRSTLRRMPEAFLGHPRKSIHIMAGWLAFLGNLPRHFRLLASMCLKVRGDMNVQPALSIELNFVQGFCKPVFLICV